MLGFLKYAHPSLPLPPPRIHPPQAQITQDSELGIFLLFKTEKYEIFLNAKYQARVELIYLGIPQDILKMKHLLKMHSKKAVLTEEVLPFPQPKASPGPQPTVKERKFNGDASESGRNADPEPCKIMKLRAHTGLAVALEARLSP